MAKINVAKAFNFTGPDGIITRIHTGLQEVEQHVADHWFTQAHLFGSSDGTVESLKQAYDEAKANADSASQVAAEAKAKYDAAVAAKADSDAQATAKAQAEAKAQDKADSDAKGDGGKDKKDK